MYLLHMPLEIRDCSITYRGFVTRNALRACSAPMILDGAAFVDFVNRLSSDVRTIFPMYVEDETERRVNCAPMDSLAAMTLEAVVERVVTIAVRWFNYRLEPIGVHVGNSLPASIALRAFSHFTLYADVHQPTFEDVARHVADLFVGDMEKLWGEARKIE